MASKRQRIAEIKEGQDQVNEEERKLMAALQARVEELAPKALAWDYLRTHEELPGATLGDYVARAQAWSSQRYERDPGGYLPPRNPSPGVLAEWGNRKS